MSSPYPAILTIDQNAVRDNIRIIKDKIGPHCQFSGVVKANAYGLGIDNVIDAFTAEDCQTYFVATLDEAIYLRNTIGPSPAIFMFQGFWHDHIDEYVAHNICPVLSNIEDMTHWNHALASIPPDKRPHAAIHFDTGMNRLGVDDTEKDIFSAKLIAQDFPNIKVSDILSHFACADEPGHELNERQYTIFKDICARFQNVRKSLANSFGVFLDNRHHMDMVRPGMCLYGLNPAPHTASPMRRVITLQARVLQVRQASQGHTIGYGATYACKKNMATCTLALGYADGIHRALSNNGNVYWQGHACPILGRVSMDLITVDISALPDDIAPPHQGDYLDIISKYQSPDDLADNAGTIGYEILTSIGNRYEKNVLALKRSAS